MKKLILTFFIFSFALLSTANAQEKLIATIIGSGSPHFNENRASASVLISAGDTKILVDMGNGTQANLNKLDLKAREISSLLFTHHHLDHNEEFIPILISSLLGKHNFSIVGPPNTVKLTETNLELYKEDISYRLGKTQRTLVDRKKAFTVKDIQGGESFNIGEIEVSTIKVPHTIHAIAYRFDYKGESIVITGDLTYSSKLSVLAKNADFMIIDSGGMLMTASNNKKKSLKKSIKGKKSKVRAHLDLSDSSTIAQNSNVKNLVYTHFIPGKIDIEASMKEIRKNYSGNVIFAKDLMKIKITDNKTNLNIKNSTNTYNIVDSGQEKFYNNDSTISTLEKEDDFFGQDASYNINAPSYTDNSDGTIRDNITGLIWQKDMGAKLSFTEAMKKINSFKLAGHSDWRVPTIKELYSLIQFKGSVKGQKSIAPFIDTKYFNQPLGDTSKGEREIDAQTWSSTQYVGKTMKNDDTVFGVNFVDGRIKGYPKYNPRTKNANKMYFRFVRGNKKYGKNSFVDNKNGTISDIATGLMWQQSDSIKGMNWKDALIYAKNKSLGGYSDWRLPNAKELQSIVDYTRSPETSDSAAIDPIFEISSIKNEGGQLDYPYFWTSTTHLDGIVPQSGAVYIAFGKALGKMRGNIMDVHGAGSQRSDPKTGKSMSRGPQGDMIRVKNYVRLVRGGTIKIETNSSEEDISKYVNNNSNNNSNEKNIQKDQRKLSSNSKFINRLDKNKDGKVSLSEFPRADKQFNHLDKNSDGYITEDEAPKGPPKKR